MDRIFFKHALALGALDADRLIGPAEDWHEKDMNMGLLPNMHVRRAQRASRAEKLPVLRCRPIAGTHAPNKKHVNTPTVNGT